MKIQASSVRGNFKVVNGNWEILELKYEKWFSTKASARYRSQDIRIQAKDFWGSKYMILKNKKEIGEISFNWKGHVVIKLTDTDGVDHEYVMKGKGMWKLRFEIFDENEDLVLSMFSINKWNKLNLDYRIEKTEHEPPFDEHEFLLYCGYAANLYVARMGAS
ncbi:aminotransferase [Flavilitoribacter nigricans]|uniref:Aminotransferase n=1 Tax=Flavilitoribacter nigricans (strain ATCC 23147 / DSM 23189 / NBRC 102662 / NCIMB 1420 / SS-2) TaxID=1122177 RepID=A0A2D0NIF0_FLAN2|nr:aminotransferase [Flavilitoribacter nigricans]PHN08271.1 aminotransferase [Flavilitoribacter nigricans DSM 23189 = NBRC 102662]